MTLFRHRDSGELAACQPGTRLHRRRIDDPAWVEVNAAAQRWPDAPTYDEAATTTDVDVEG